MEYLILGIILGICGYLFYKEISWKIKNDEFNMPIKKIDDKNFIINNKIVSFEEDIPLLRMKQEAEDDKHYRNFMLLKIQRDRKMIFNNYLKTTRAIKMFPDLLENVTDKALEDITEQYNKYVFMCNKLKELIILTKKEFLIQETNPALCVDFSSFVMILRHVGSYNIYNEKTAKYYNGNMQKMIEKEFEEKWY